MIIPQDNGCERGLRAISVHPVRKRASGRFVAGPGGISGKLESMVSRQPVESVFFDAAGTLFRVRGSVGQVYGRVAARYGFELPSDAVSWAELGKAFGQSFRRHEPMLFPGRPVESLPRLERAWWREVVFGTFAPFGRFPRFEEFFDEVYDFFGTARPWVLERDCKSVLADLKGRGFRLGVISNFDSRLEGVLESLGIREFFDSVTISSICGAAKPDAAIFERALRDATSAPERAIHVGDDPEDDVMGARGVGMIPLLFDPEDRWSGHRQPRIRRLAEVEGFLL